MGAEGPQEVDTEDEVEAAQVNAGARDGEVLIVDCDRYVSGNPMALEVITVSHGDPELLPARRLER